MMHRDDIEASYPLIAAYVERPELAFSVDEFILDDSSWPSGRGSFFSGADQFRELNEPALPVREESHVELKAYAQNMGLQEDSTRKMLQALDWKKRHLKGERPDSPKGFNAHNKEYAYAAAAILLSFCKNITTLHVHGVGRGLLREFLLKSNYGLITQPALQQVQNVEIIPPGGTRWSDSYDRLEFLDYFEYFHRLPSIQSISMEGVQQYQNERDIFPPGTGSIKKIHIGHSDVSGDLIGTMIRIPKGLEEFSFSLGGLFSTDGGMPIISPRTLGKSLWTQRDTLKVLDIDVDLALHNSARAATTSEEDGEYDGTEEGLYETDQYFQLDKAISSGPLSVKGLPNTRLYGNTIGSLHDFAALSRLTLSVKLLLGTSMRLPDSSFGLAKQPPFRLIDALPPNLEYFCLRGYARGKDADVDDHIDEFLEKKGQRLPHLTEVKGIGSIVPSLEAFYSEDMGEDEVWKGPEFDLDWMEVS